MLLTLLGICAASDVGGVHETEAEELLVQMVPVASPKEYVMVCVKDVEARVTVMIPAEPIVVAGMDMEDFRGIVAVGVPSVVVVASHQGLGPEGQERGRVGEESAFQILRGGGLRQSVNVLHFCALPSVADPDREVSGAVLPKAELGLAALLVHPLRGGGEVGDRLLSEVPLG